MHRSLTLVLLSSLASLSIACGGGGAAECEKAFDKAIECSENPEEAREQAKAIRKEAIATCNEEKSTTDVKASLACAKKSGCDEYRACELERRYGDDVKEIEGLMADGKLSDAIMTCSVRIEAYKAAPAIKAICDKVIAAVFAERSDKDVQDSAEYYCSTDDDVAQWLAVSAPLKAGCTALAADFKVRAMKQRDEGLEADSTCSSYKKMVKHLTPEKLAAAEMLCSEVRSVEDLEENIAEVTKAISEKTKTIPYACDQYFQYKKPIEGSEWHAAKVKELARLCFGEVGKGILAEATGAGCPYDGEDVHKYAAKYSLAEDDAELAALLKKTAAACTKQ